MPRAILFDAVGTLLYPEPEVARAYARIGRQFGSQLDEAEIARRFSPAVRRAAELRRSTLPDPGATDEQQEWERWRTIVTTVFAEDPHAGGGLFFALWEHFARSEHWALYDDVPETVAAFAAAGYRLGIASNFDGRLPPICRAHRPLRAIESVFVSSQLGFMKPDPRFFTAAAAALELPPEEILLVGDDWEQDYRGAKAAGWQAIHLDRSGGASSGDRIVSLSELAGYLARREALG